MIDIDKFAEQHKKMVDEFVAHYKAEAAVDTDDVWPDTMGDADWEEQLDMYIQMCYERDV